MKRFVLPALVVLSAVVAADHNPTHISWRHPSLGMVRVSSSEELWLGKTFNHYPLTYLVDGNPSTAWVFKGDLQAHLKYRQEIPGAEYSAERILPTFCGNYSVAFEFENPVLVDEVRLVAGYAKNAEVFSRNRRVREARVTLNYSATTRHRLQDSMAMQSLRVRTTEAHRVELTLDSFYEGADQDVCLSEVEFFYRGKRLDLQLPAWVESTDGSECCESDVVLASRHGIKQAELGAVIEVFWSPDGRLAGSVFAETASRQVVVLGDVAAGRLLVKAKVPLNGRESSWIEYEGSKVVLRWQSGHKVLYDSSVRG